MSKVQSLLTVALIADAAVSSLAVSSLVSMITVLTVTTMNLNGAMKFMGRWRAFKQAEYLLGALVPTLATDE